MARRTARTAEVPAAPRPARAPAMPGATLRRSGECSRSAGPGRCRSSSHGEVHHGPRPPVLPGCDRRSVRPSPLHRPGRTLDARAERGRPRGVQLEGLHHITAITADAPRNVDFYARVLGLRLVKKTVNQDDPTVYHLFYADEHGLGGGGPDVLRVPGPPRRHAPAPGWCTASPTASRPRTPWTSGRTGCAARRSRSAVRAARCGSPTRRASSTSSSWSTCRTRR